MNSYRLLYITLIMLVYSDLAFGAEEKREIAEMFPVAACEAVYRRQGLHERENVSTADANILLSITAFAPPLPKNDDPSKMVSPPRIIADFVLSGPSMGHDNLVVSLCGDGSIAIVGDKYRVISPNHIIVLRQLFPKAYSRSSESSDDNRKP